jgi:N-acetylneuraminic acid mutarotase
MLAVAASVGGSFYLVGGTSLAPDSAGKPVRTYLKNAYRFTPGASWQRVADMPFPVVAAPTPAPALGKDSFLVIGGDDGSLAQFEPKSRHPGFPKHVLRYQAGTDRWTVLGETPAPRATLPAVNWNGLIVLPSGESRPGVRSPQVWAADIQAPH